MSRSRISFKRLGKFQSHPSSNPRRLRNVKFTQAGLMSDRRPGLSLRDIVWRAAYNRGRYVHQLAEQDQLTAAGSSKVRKRLQNLETPSNHKPSTCGLSCALVTRVKANKSNVSSTRVVEVASSHVDSDSDGGEPPSVSESSGRLSMEGILSKMMPGDSHDMNIDNIDTSFEEDKQENDKLIIRRDVHTTKMKIVKMKQQIVRGPEVLAGDLLKNVFETQEEEIETVEESINLLQHQPTGKTELLHREENIETSMPSSVQTEESNKIVDSDDDLFISETPQQYISYRLKHKKPGGKIDSMVEIDEQEASSGELSQPDTTNWKFVTTNLTASEKSLVSRWVDSLHCKGISSRIDDEVTHVVVSTGPDMQSQRTLKYLQAVASGKFVVSYLWVLRAIKLGSIPPVHEFEVKDEENGGANGPWRSRVARSSGNPGIFNRFEVFISEDLEGLSKEDVEDLLLRAGARLLPDENSFSYNTEITMIIIANSATSMEAKVVNRRLHRHEVATVEKDWVLDSLGDWDPRPLLPYMMEQVTVEDLVKAGYSAKLTNAEI